MAKTFQELGAWQRARELRKQCLELTRRLSVRDDFQMRDQLRAASRSASANIAEGFGRFSNKDFARFCRISKGSELELLDHFQDCFDCGYINAKELDQLDHAARKALKAVNGLSRFLEETPDPEWRKKPPPRQPRRSPKRDEPAKREEPVEPANPHEPKEPAEPEEL